MLFWVCIYTCHLTKFVKWYVGVIYAAFRYGNANITAGAMLYVVVEELIPEMSEDAVHLTVKNASYIPNYCK